jgi:hypothetical protein
MYWESYTNSFNTVFQKEYSEQYFKDKYLNNYLKDSYHGLILDGEMIIGACTAIPYKYCFFGEKISFALFVDAFVLENYRKNEFILYDAYIIVQNKLIEDSIPYIISVPNNIAYPFWKKLAGWKDIGIIPWYVMPLKIGNILRKSKLLNISYVLFLLYFILCRVVSLFFNSKKQGNIHLDEDFLYSEYRFADRKYHKIRNTKLFYCVNTEEHIKAAYLLGESDFSFKEISKAVWDIIIKENVDIIIYIGNINAVQFALIKLPKSLQPRQFYLCGKEIIDIGIDDRIYSYSNWDFGLKNFDVR